MKTFYVVTKTTAVHFSRYRVEAESEYDARQAVLEGEAENIDFCNEVLEDEVICDVIEK